MRALTGIMFERRALLATILAPALLLTACGGPAPESAPTASPTQAVALPATPGNVITASVKVEPVHSAAMAFLIGGRVKEVNVAAGDEVKAGQALVLLDLPDLQYAAVSAKAEVDSAALNSSLQGSTRQYKVWNGRKWIWTHGLPEVGRQADARLQQAQGALNAAAAELGQGTLVAPYDATVASVEAASGEMVQPNETVVVLGDLSHLQIVTTDLSERDIARVRIGQTATVQLKAFAEPLRGTVSAIELLGRKSEDGDTVYKVILTLDAPPDGLFWGMTGDAQIEVDSSQ